MKTTRSKVWMAVYASVLATAAAYRASADQPEISAPPEKNYVGTIASFDPQEHVLNVKGWAMFRKTFNIGTTCACSQWDKNNATVNDLRPGERVRVRYQYVHGVCIADRIDQEPMQFTGSVAAIDPGTHTLIVHQRGLDKTLQLAGDCKVVLRNDQAGALSAVQVGDHVTVTYETPGDMPTARQIAQTSQMFTGSLTAIDLDNKTVKAKALSGTKKFNLADNCAIVINGRENGRLADLKPAENLTFSYDEINGVNVVNRIGPATVPTHSVANYMPVAPINGF